MDILSIDVGGTSFKYGLVNDKGELFDTGSVKRQKENNLGVIIDLIKEIQSKYKIEGVALSLPGNPIDATGQLDNAGDILDMFGINVFDELKKHFDLKVAIENDANCAMLAEYWKGPTKDMKNVVMVAIGTGIGGGVIINGELYQGQRNLAGEFHNLMLGFDMDDNLIPWGSLASTINGLIIPCADILGQEEVDGQEMYKSSNQDIKDVIEEFHKNVAAGLISLANTFDPEKIIIGGAISKNAKFISGVNAWMQKFKNPFPVCEAIAAQFGNDANLLGAAYKYKLKFK